MFFSTSWALTSEINFSKNRRIFLVEYKTHFYYIQTMHVPRVKKQDLVTNNFEKRSRF